MARSAVFGVRLSRASAVEVRVDWQTKPGTATTPDDYWNLSGTLIFDPGKTSAQIVIPVRVDVAGVPEEYFTVELSNPYNASLNKRSGRAVLPGRAVDSQPHISIDNPTVPSA